MSHQYQEAPHLQQPQLGIPHHSSSQPSSQGDVHHSQPYPQSQDPFVSSSHAPTLQPELHQQNPYGQAPAFIVQQGIVYRGAVPMNAQMSTDSNATIYAYHNMPNPHFTSIGAGFQQCSTNQTSGSSTNHPKGSSSLNQAALVEQKIKNDFGFYTFMLYAYAAFFTYNGGAVISGFIFYSDHILFDFTRHLVPLVSFILVSLILVGLCVIAIKAKLNLNAKLQYWTYILLYVYSVFVLLGILMILPFMITEAAEREGLLERMILVAVVVFYVLNFVLVYYARTISKLMDERSHLLGNSSHSQSSQNVSFENLFLKEAASIEQRISRNFDFYTCVICFEILWAIFGTIKLIGNGKVSSLITLSYIGGGILALKAKSSFSSKQQLYVFVLLCIKATYVLYQTISSALDIIGNLKYYLEQDLDNPFEHFFVPIILIICFQVLASPLLMYYGYRLRKLMKERDRLLNKASSNAKSI